MAPTDDDHLNPFELAMRAVEAGRAAEALVRCEAALQQSPADVAWCLLYAEILTAVRRLDDALEVLDSVAPEGTDEERLYLQARAEVEERRGNTDRAVDHLRRAAAADLSTASWILLGACLARHGRFDEAKQAFEAATAMPGDPEEAFLNLGLVLRAQGRFAEAIAATRRALTATHPDEDACELLADLERALTLQQHQRGCE